MNFSAVALQGAVNPFSSGLKTVASEDLWHPNPPSCTAWLLMPVRGVSDQTVCHLPVTAHSERAGYHCRPAGSSPRSALPSLGQTCLSSPKPPGAQRRVLGINAICTGLCSASWTRLIPQQTGINHFVQRAAGPRHKETPLPGLNPRRVAALCPGGWAGLLERLRGGFQTRDMV